MNLRNLNNIIGSGYNFGKVASFIHPTVMGKTEWFRANPYADWALRAEDFELWTRTSSESNFYAIGKPLLFYREFGIPTFRKYYLSQRTLLKIFRRYQHYSKSFSWFITNTIKTCSKILVYAIFATMGKSDYLISRRRRQPIPKKLWLTDADIIKSINEI